MWLAQSGHLIHWAPVMFASGIGVYFTLKWEPGGTLYVALAAGLLGIIGILGVWRSLWAPLLWVPLLFGLGFGAAGFRAHSVAGPVLDWRYYGPVQGRIAGMDRSGSDAVRLTLDQVVLSNVRPEKKIGRAHV